MATGQQLLRLAEAHIGESYEYGALVPKDNPNWKGPWDCAEFASWLVFQKTGRLYGCGNNGDKPSTADAYSGHWIRDVDDGTLLSTTQDDADSCAGIVLMRLPSLPKKLPGHVALSDGVGGTVEAADRRHGVRRDKVRGRIWDRYARIPNVDYTKKSDGTSEVEPPRVIQLEADGSNVEGPVVRHLQRALKERGFDPGKIDGRFGPHTTAAVAAFQAKNGLVADGQFGPRTAKKLRLDWSQ